MLEKKAKLSLASKALVYLFFTAAFIIEDR